jgi:NADH-quinone oxidoreductase subunit E
VLQVNYEFYDNQTPESAVELVDRLRRGEKPAPTRGAPLSDWRTVSLELAGFYPEDEQAFRTRVDGPSAAVETLRGAKLATERGWTAPAMPDDAQLPSVDAGKK